MAEIKKHAIQPLGNGLQLVAKIWLPDEMGAWVGGVFQLETVDEALLVICYPGIWIDPKLKAERRTASARPQQLHWCWRRASPAWRAEAPRVALLCNERGLELSLPLPAPAGLRRSNPKPSTKRRVLLMNFIKAPYTKL